MTRLIRILVLVLLCVFSISPAEPKATVTTARKLPTVHTRSAVMAGKAQAVGVPSPDQVLHLTLALPTRDDTGKMALFNDIYDPKSPNFRHFLSEEEYTRRFAPRQSDYDAVKAFAEESGFSVTSTPRNRMLIGVDGSVSAIERAFRIHMKVYQHPTENRVFYAPDREPTVNLPVSLWHIGGLDNYSLPRSSLVSVPIGELKLNHPLIGSGPGHFYTGANIRAAYYSNDQTAFKGTGQSVALLQFEGYWKQDVLNYFSETSDVINVPITNILLDGGAVCQNPCEDKEAVADIVQTVGMAPGLSAIYVYIGPQGEVDDVSILNQIAADDNASQISVSYQWEPADTTSDDPIFQEFALQGQSIFVASGDCGAYLEGPVGLCDSDTGTQTTAAFPAEDPYVTAVGGTDLTTNWAGGPRVSESGWIHSGGGIADGIPIPPYQVGTVLRQNGASATLRNVPDVAAEGNTDNFYCDDGVCPDDEALGGTSLAAPRWAGFMALVNQMATFYRKPRVGFVNPTIYAMQLSPEFTPPLFSISSGNNGGYNAVSPYNLVAGLGTPNGLNTMEDLGYVAFPIVSYVTPPSGPTGGGTTVTLIGHNFLGTNQVNFGTAIAPNFTVVSDTEITAVTPSGILGICNVYAINKSGPSLPTLNAVFTFVSENPATITSVLPSSGPATGGTEVTITGSGFTGTESVQFGSVTAASFNVASDTSITAVSPAENAGTVNVVVYTRSSSSVATSADQFTFTGASQSPLAASVLPGGQSVQIGIPVTIFASMVNAGNVDLSGCNIALPSGMPASLESFYQITNPATNSLTGTRNTPVPIAAGATQTFVVGFLSYQPVEELGLALQFDCTGVPPAPSYVGLDTVDLLFSSNKIPDIISAVATSPNDGIVTVPESTGGGAAFAMATDNTGAAGTVVVSLDTGSTVLPINAAICQTVPGAGTCMETPASALTMNVGSGETQTFSVFVTATAPIILDAITNRIFVRFKGSDGTPLGSISVAVATD